MFMIYYFTDLRSGVLRTEADNTFHVHHQLLLYNHFLSIKILHQCRTCNLKWS